MSALQMLFSPACNGNFVASVTNRRTR